MGAWPSFSVDRGGAQALGPQVNTAASMVYGVAGETFVLSPCAVVGEAAHDLFCGTPTTQQLLLQGGGFAHTEAGRAAGPRALEEALVPPRPC